MKEIIKRVFNKVFIIEDGYKLKVEEVKKGIPHNSEFSISLMDISDLNEMREKNPSELSERKFKILEERILDKMKRVYIIREMQNIAGYCCVAYDKTYENGIRLLIPVDNTSFYLFDDYVFEKYRGRGIHKFSVITRIEKSMGDKRRNALVYIYRNNQKSRRTYESLGFKKYISCYYIPLFRKLFIKKVQI